jgi:predicted nucleotidyltransferase
LNIVQNLENRNLIKPPKWLSDSIHFLATTGSVAYGVSTDKSDNDVYGFCIPSKETLFPHLAGAIPKFGTQPPSFDQYIQHGVIDVDKKCNWDITVFNIVKYFDLALVCNPNVIELLFVPQDCILSITQVGQLVRENRKMFLHKGAWPKCKGYAYSSLHKMSNRNIRMEFLNEIKTRYDIKDLTITIIEDEISNRQIEQTEGNGYFSIPQGLDKLTSEELFKCRDILSSKRNQKILEEEQVYDRKFACHCVRLLLQAEQILAEGDLDLRKHSDHLKAIRRGDVSEDEIRKWASSKEKELEKLYHDSKLPWGPDEPAIKDLLLKCLEHHYGSLDKCVERLDKYEIATNKIREILDTL